MKDLERALVRIVMKAAGCFECQHVIIKRGRNVNAYGCRIGSCERMRYADEAAAMFLKEDLEKEGKPCPTPPSGS